MIMTLYTPIELQYIGSTSLTDGVICILYVELFWYLHLQMFVQCFHYSI